MRRQFQHTGKGTINATLWIASAAARLQGWLARKAGLAAAAAGKAGAGGGTDAASCRCRQPTCSALIPRTTPFMRRLTPGVRWACSAACRQPLLCRAGCAVLVQGVAMRSMPRAPPPSSRRYGDAGEGSAPSSSESCAPQPPTVGAASPRPGWKGCRTWNPCCFTVTVECTSTAAVVIMAVIAGAAAAAAGAGKGGCCAGGLVHSLVCCGEAACKQDECVGHKGGK